MPYSPTPATITTPELLDELFDRINTHLSGEISWLTTAYGRAVRLARQLEDMSQVVYPAIYTANASGKEYLNLLPDEHLGEYLFWWVDDGWNVDEWNHISKNKYLINCSLIAWYDLRNIYPATWKANSNQNVIREVFTALSSLGERWIRIEPQRIFEEAPNIYREFTHREIDRQYRMRPFGGFRVEMEITYIEPC